jgi:hypothetical protein
MKHGTRVQDCLLIPSHGLLRSSLRVSCAFVRDSIHTTALVYLLYIRWCKTPR